MRRLIVSINISLDGFMSGPDRELDWHFRSWSNEIGDALCVELAKADTILLGRITYSAMAKYWIEKLEDPTCRGEDFVFANMMNSYAKIVFSKSNISLEWNNSRHALKNISDEIHFLKRKPGKNIIVYGSETLTRSLIESELVDEFQLWVHPVVLGIGKPLFKNLVNQFQLELVNVKSFPTGVVLLRYQQLRKKK